MPLSKMFFGINNNMIVDRNELVEQALNQRSEKFLIALNSDKLMAISEDQNLVNICNQNIVYFDGVGACWAYRKKFGIRIKKVAGVELYLEIAKRCAKLAVPVGIIGGNKEQMIEIKAKLEENIPNLIIAATSDGFVSKEVWPKVLRDFRQKNVEFIFAGMGSPKQEVFLAQAVRVISVGGMGVGGSFKVLIGENKRAPSMFLKLNLEFLYRYFMNGVPASRIIRDFKFFLCVLLGRY